MAVMHNMREKSAIILFILLVLFVLSMMVGGLVGGADIVDILTGKNPNVIGVVNGAEISAREFDIAFNRELDAYRDQTGRTVPDNQVASLRDRVWEALIQEKLIQQEIMRDNLQATDGEILFRIQDAPPEILTSNPSFQNENQQFDLNKYQQFLQQSNANDLVNIENYLRLTLPREKLQARLGATVRVTEDEIKYEYLKQNQRARVDYVFINSNSFSDSSFEVGQQQINAYYREHKEDFEQPAQRIIEYAIFSLAPTAEDSAQLYTEAESLIEQIKAGADFAELASVNSEDAVSAEKGGDLGFFKAGDMVKPFEEAAFAAKPGDIVGPIRSSFGLHIIKVEDKKKENGEEQVKASHILLKFAPSDKTQNRIVDSADRLSIEAGEGDFLELAKKYGATQALRSSAFPKSRGWVPGIGLNSEVSREIFRSKVGQVGEVQETTQGHFLYKLVAIEPERIQAIDEVAETIKAQLANEERMRLAARQASEVYERVNSGMSLEQAAASDSLEVKETPEFSRAGYISGIGREPKFNGAAFGIQEVGGIAPPIEGARGYFVIRLKEKQNFDEADFNAKKEGLTAQVLQRKRGQVFANWYADVRDRADIQDNRERFF
jgi:parvulin-like peptidyl-prolyl isomerase